MIPIKINSFFANVFTAARLPESSTEIYDAVHTVIRNPYVNLKTVFEAMDSKGISPGQVSVYADTLYIAKGDRPLKISSGLTLVARQLVVEDGASFEIDYTESHLASLVMYTRHIQGSFSGTVALQDSPQTTDVSGLFAASPNLCGIKVYYRLNLVDGTGTVQVAKFQDFSGINLAELSPLKMLLGTTFQIATVIYQTEPELTKDMLSWIVAIGNSAKEGVELNAQSAAFLAELTVSSDVSSVPDLSRDFYVSEFAGLVELAKIYEAQYNRFADLSNTLEDRKTAANILLSKENDTADYYQRLYEQANNNFTNAQAAIDRGIASLTTQTRAVEIAGVDLNTAMTIWLKEQEIKLALDIITTVLSFAVSIGTMCVGMEGGAAATTKAVSDAAKNTVAYNTAMKALAERRNEITVTELQNALSEDNLFYDPLVPAALEALKNDANQLLAAAQNAQTAAPLLNMAAYITKLKEMMDNLKNSVDIISKLIANTQQIIAASRIFSIQPNPIKLPSEPGAIDQSADGYDLTAFQDALTNWDIFQVTVEGLLDSSVALATSATGTKPLQDAVFKYRTELEKLVIYGKAVITSQLSAIQFGREASNLILQKQINENQKTRLQRYIDQLSEDATKDEEMMHLLFSLQLNTKRWLYISLQNYRRAYRYWALRDSTVSFSITQSAAEFVNNKTQMEADFKNALQQFKPRVPQNMNRLEIIIPDTPEGLYKDVVKNFRDTGETQFVISLGDENLAGYERVRIDRVRIWLEGVDASVSAPVQVLFSNIGSFSDRLTLASNGDTSPKVFAFSGPLLQREFDYQGVIGDANQIKVDGNVAEDMAIFYSQPTPFTEWSVKAPQGSKFDRTKVTAFRLELSGSVLGRLSF